MENVFPINFSASSWFPLPSSIAQRGLPPFPNKYVNAVIIVINGKQMTTPAVLLPRLPESFQYTYGLQHCTTGSEAVPTSSESRPPEYSDIHFPSKNPSDVLSFPGSTFFYSTANAVRHSFFLMYIIAPPFLSFQIFQLILPLFSIFSTWHNTISQFYHYFSSWNHMFFSLKATKIHDYLLFLDLKQSIIKLVFLV